MAHLAERSGVTKRFGTVVALDGLDLYVSPGELFSLLGPNGAGKSTAISLLLGLPRADAGKVGPGMFGFGVALAAPAFVNLIYLPMVYLSGLFFPLPAVSPEERRKVARLSSESPGAQHRGDCSRQSAGAHRGVGRRDSRIHSARRTSPRASRIDLRRSSFRRGLVALEGVAI